jgi:hypothetical protein
MNMRKKYPNNFVGYIRKADGSLVQVLHKKGEDPQSAIRRVMKRHKGVFIGKLL